MTAPTPMYTAQVIALLMITAICAHLAAGFLLRRRRR